jgi:hypothetical protein
VGGRGSGSGATGAEPQKLQSPAAEQGSSRRRLPPCRELAPPSVAAWLECWLLPQDRVCSVPWGVFVTLYRAGPSNVIRPGLGWPASPAATNRVCVHVRNEPGLVQMLFATPSVTYHHMPSREIFIPCTTSMPRAAEPRKNELQRRFQGARRSRRFCTQTAVLVSSPDTQTRLVAARERSRAAGPASQTRPKSERESPTYITRCLIQISPLRITYPGK